MRLVSNCAIMTLAFCDAGKKGGDLKVDNTAYRARRASPKGRDDASCYSCVSRNTMTPRLSGAKHAACRRLNDAWNKSTASRDRTSGLREK